MMLDFNLLIYKKHKNQTKSTVKTFICKSPEKNSAPAG